MTAFASAAAASPSMYFRGGSVSETSVIVGENVTVTGTVENVGDSSGGFTFEFERNNTEFASPRVTVESDERRSVNRTIRFDSPGTYEITVNDDLAGYVEVRPTDVRVDQETADERRLSVRARDVSTSAAQAYDVPAATNRSFALERWSVRTVSGTYNQTLTEYSTPANASIPVPADDRATLVGLLTVSSDATVESTTTRFAVDRSSLQRAGLTESTVTVYQRNGTRWEAVATTVTESTTERVVYEASGTGGAAYAVGDIDTGVSVVDSTLRTDATDSGQRITLEATVSNDGSVDTPYDAAMLVDGAQVNSTTVTVPGDGERTVVLAHEVTEADSYEIALNDRNAGTVVITSGQVSDGSGSDAESGGVLDDVSVPLPATVFGIDSLYVAGGAGIVLGLLIGIAVLSRRGGSEAPPSSFDEL